MEQASEAEAEAAEEHGTLGLDGAAGDAQIQRTGQLGASLMQTGPPRPTVCSIGFTGNPPTTAEWRTLVPGLESGNPLRTHETALLTSV